MDISKGFRCHRSRRTFDRCIAEPTENVNAVATGASMRAVCMFSCLGLHSVGLARAGIETVQYCEIDPWRQEKIRERAGKRAIVHADCRDFRPVKAEILIGGPPCQQTSVAAAIHGKRNGRTLWPYMRRHVVGFEWVVVEQPPGNKAWEAKVSGDLAKRGFHVARVEFAASDVGAPYPRRRVYILACTSLSRLQIAWSSIPSEIASVKRAANARADWCPRKLATLPVDARSAGDGEDRKRWIEALGDSNPPHMAEVIGRAIKGTRH